MSEAPDDLKAQIAGLYQATHDAVQRAYLAGHRDGKNELMDALKKTLGAAFAQAYADSTPKEEQ